MTTLFWDHPLGLASVTKISTNKENQWQSTFFSLKPFKYYWMRGRGGNPSCMDFFLCLPKVYHPITKPLNNPI